MVNIIFVWNISLTTLLRICSIILSRWWWIAFWENHVLSSILNCISVLHINEKYILHENKRSLLNQQVFTVICIICISQRKQERLERKLSGSLNLFWRRILLISQKELEFCSGHKPGRVDSLLSLLSSTNGTQGYFTLCFTLLTIRQNFPHHFQSVS